MADRLKVSVFAKFTGDACEYVRINAPLSAIGAELITFHRCKSAIKYLEYSSLGVPGIYSDLEPYRNVIRNGENSLLAKAPEDFFELLEELIQNKSLRLSVAQKAVQDIKTNRLLSKNRDIWVKAYFDVKTSKKSENYQNSVIMESNAQMFMRVE